VTRACTINLLYQLQLPEIKPVEGILDLDLILRREGQKAFSMNEVTNKEISKTAITLKIEDLPQDLSYEAYTNILNYLSIKVNFANPPSLN
jgi:hypothetical protein